MKLYFDGKIEIGHLLTAVTVVVAAITLFYQARSTEIAEKQLRSEVQDISKLVADIKKESDEREKLNLDLLDAEIAQKRDVGEIIEIATNNLLNSESISRDNFMNVITMVSTLALMLNDSIATKCAQQERIPQQIHEFGDALVAMIMLIDSHFMVLQALSDTMDVRHDALGKQGLSPEQYQNESARLIKRFETDIADANQRFAEALKAPSTQRENALSALTNSVSNATRCMSR